MSLGLLTGLIVVSLGLVLTLVFGVGAMTAVPRRQLEEVVDSELIGHAAAAYERADWPEAARLFQEIRQQFPGHKRTEYFLVRIELTRRDAEVLARAEEAWVLGESERARALAAEVAPNSPLFAQAEGFIRAAERAQRAGGSAEPRARQTSSAGLGVGVWAALGEAVALYEGGQFEEAAQRAQGLADRATGGTQKELAAWATDAATFGPLYRGLPAEPEALLQKLDDVERAIALDARLSEGYYARGLKTRAAKALAASAAKLSAQGRWADACELSVRAASLSPQERLGGSFERRCENDAMRKVTQARAAEARAPALAKALYEQARMLSTSGNPAQRAAEAALVRLGSSATARTAQ